MTYLYHGDIPSQTQPAGVDLTGKWGYFSKNVNGKTFLCDAGEPGLGPLMNEGALNEPVRSALGGTVAFIAGASIAADARVASDADGKGVTAVADDFYFGTNRYAVGAGEQGDLTMNGMGIEPTP